MSETMEHHIIKVKLYMKSHEICEDTLKRKWEGWIYTCKNTRRYFWNYLEFAMCILSLFLEKGKKCCFQCLQIHINSNGKNSVNCKISYLEFKVSKPQFLELRPLCEQMLASVTTLHIHKRNRWRCVRNRKFNSRKNHDPGDAAKLWPSHFESLKALAEAMLRSHQVLICIQHNHWMVLIAWGKLCFPFHGALNPSGTQDTTFIQWGSSHQTLMLSSSTHFFHRNRRTSGFYFHVRLLDSGGCFFAAILQQRRKEKKLF